MNSKKVMMFGSGEESNSVRISFLRQIVLEMLKQETIEEPLSFVNSLKKLKMYYENQHEDDTPQINIKEKPTDTED